MPLNKDIKKVLVIGSGPIVIGQAAEFDYAGTQACRVLKDAGLNVVLINSNPATIMTDPALADEIYLEPLTVETIKRVIIKERPDCMLAGVGGQTGLTMAMELSKDGFLDNMGVRLLGTNAESIIKAEDRQLFKDTMESIGQPTVPSATATDLDSAVKIAEKIGYPVIIRPAFTLGGSGGGVANSREELLSVAHTGLDASPISQILVEKYIFGWKEIEFETMRDAAGHAIIVCSMENVDPVGVHTGDSIVVAPALTLAKPEYQLLRTAALEIVNALEIIGGCNCQFALNPDSMEYAVIEVNPRVSRSSALASKATGYPIAKITAKLALGYNLDEIINDITGCTSACFEPAVDYVVVKLPKWPFDKFMNASRKLGTQMKATGEVMAIAPSFEMALMKAVRGVEISQDTLDMPHKDNLPLEQRLRAGDDMRVFTIYEALKSGMSVDEIFDITRIDRYFLNCIKHLVDYELEIEGQELDDYSYGMGKWLGYTDEALMRISASTQPPYSAHAAYKMVDSCAAEYDAKTPYFYSTFDSFCESETFGRSGKPVIMVLGSGPIRIGQGIEFDYSSVHCVWTLRKLGYDVVIVNNNPETVSTDYDTADRLYFEPLTPEDIMDIIRVEQPIGVVVAFGGQTAIKLTKFLDEQGIEILGTSAESIDIAEDRERFEALLRELNIEHPKGYGVMTMEEALSVSEDLGYPVLLRPSYVIGGQNMTIARSAADVEKYMNIILSGDIANPVLIDKYMMGIELDVDVISDGNDVLIPGIMEHIERAGVHSGDSIAVYPPYNLSDLMLDKVVECSTKLALALGTKGLVNIQYLVCNNQLYVIEVNPRASRTIPYISKVTGVPMVELATRAMLGEPLAEMGYGVGLYKTPPYVAVKVPVFSFEKLSDANAVLGPEMKSTGEVMGIGKTMTEALYKGLTAAGMEIKIPSYSNEVGALISVETHDVADVISLAKRLNDCGVHIYATPDTADVIKRLGIDVTTVCNMHEGDDMFRLLESGKVNYVVYTGALLDGTVGDYISLHRRALQLSVSCLTSLDTANAMAMLIASRYNQNNTELIDINNLRTQKQQVNFTKIEAAGSDYICIADFDHQITGPESLCVTLCDRYMGVGGEGIVILEKSEVADAKIHIYTASGALECMGGNTLRCAGKFLYDNGYTTSRYITVEVGDRVHKMLAYTSNDRVRSAAINMGRADFVPSPDVTTIAGTEIIDFPVTIDGQELRINYVSMGNPHCIIFTDDLDLLDINKLGSLLSRSGYFPQGVNIEFVRMLNESSMKMRCYERSSGETLSSGTGACAAVSMAVKLGLCTVGNDVTVKCNGGDLIVRYTDPKVFLFGNARQVYQGMVEI